MTLIYSKKTLKQLKKIDISISNRIITYMENIAKLKNPREHGKRLSGQLSSFWRYRVGDYRILCDISDDELTVLVVDIAHRKEVYR